MNDTKTLPTTFTLTIYIRKNDTHMHTHAKSLLFFVTYFYIVTYMQPYYACIKRKTYSGLRTTNSARISAHTRLNGSSFVSAIAFLQRCEYDIRRSPLHAQCRQCFHKACNYEWIKELCVCTDIHVVTYMHRPYT